MIRVFPWRSSDGTVPGEEAGAGLAGSCSPEAQSQAPRGDSRCGVAGGAPSPVLFLALGKGRWDGDGRSRRCTKQLAAGPLWMEWVCPEAGIVQISPF